MVEHIGGCLCGAIRFRAWGEPSRTNICYCTRCRRQTGSPMVSFVTFPAAGFELLSGSVLSYRASDFATRQFCGRCGSALFWRRDGSDELDIFLGSLDRPAEVPMPQKQIWTQHRMAWVPAQREIPAFKENS